MHQRISLTRFSLVLCVAGAQEVYGHAVGSGVMAAECIDLVDKEYILHLVMSEPSVQFPVVLPAFLLCREQHYVSKMLWIGSGIVGVHCEIAT